MKKQLGLAAALTVIAGPALAHHPLNGLPMETFAQGALSGVGHPILGFDHLFFVALMGVAATFTARRLATPAAYIAAMLAGCLIVSLGGALPLAEGMVVLSLLVLGGLVATGRKITAPVAMAIFAAFGLFHGAAFGGTIAGQEGGAGTAVLLGYLIGLGVTQYLLALAAGWAVRAFGAASSAAIPARMAGAMVAGVGLFLALEVAEGPLVALISAAA